MKKAPGKIRVLLMCDSQTFRGILTTGLIQDRSLEVAATSVSLVEAGYKIAVFQPDVIICNGEKLNKSGWELIRKIDAEHSIPFIIVSPPGPSVFRGLRGGVYFVGKPENFSPQNVEKFFKELVMKVRMAARSQKKLREATSYGWRLEAEKVYHKGIIAIGASAGGTEAILSIVKSLPTTIPGIVIVQHIPPVFSRMFAERLDSESDLHVKEAEHGDFVEPGQVLIAPGDRHMKIKRAGGRYQVILFEGEKVNGHLPSIDVLFESVAREAGKEAIGIILTGMGNDGAKGLLAIRNRGGRTIGQDAATSAVYGMPKAAWDIGAVEKQAPLQDIPKVLLHFIRQMDTSG